MGMAGAQPMTKGGKQPGAGRPPSTDPARHSIKARLTSSQYAKWKEIGGSRWLKRMLAAELVNSLISRKVRIKYE